MILVDRFLAYTFVALSFSPSNWHQLPEMWENIEDMCPNCGQSPHDTVHLFNCPSNQTELSVTDFWKKTVHAAVFLGLYRMEASDKEPSLRRTAGWRLQYKTMQVFYDFFNLLNLNNKDFEDGLRKIFFITFESFLNSESLKIGKICKLVTKSIRYFYAIDKSF